MENHPPTHSVAACGVADGAAFDASALRRDHDYLAACPKAFRRKLYAMPVGSLRERVAGLNQWREALLAGKLPEPVIWPEPGITTPLLKTLTALGITRFTQGEPEVTDTLLHDILRSIESQWKGREDRIAEELRKLEALEREKHDLAAEESESENALEREPDETLLNRLRAEAERAADAQRPDTDAALNDAWSERVRVWSAMSSVFGDFGDKLGRGWDFSRAVLKHIGWMNAARLKELVGKIPQLKAIIASLGRLQTAEDGECITEKILVPMSRMEEERREIRTPHVPAEMRGIERSGAIARMLPAEASLLGHPKLRLLWHARRAENALMTYRIEGTEIEITQVERHYTLEQEKTTPRPQRGPIMAIIDTSGSMHGVPEQVAKALVLEAVRTAHAEKRPCFLYAYSGPGNVLEHELDLTEKGIGPLLDFFGFSFGGGNDEVGVLRKSLAKLRENRWQKADILFVSDGEWPVPHAALDEVRAAKAAGTRFHGVQIGNRGQTGLHAICDPVHVFSDWSSVR